MKNRQVRNAEARENRKINKQNSQKNNGLNNNKTKKINTKNLPTFILIGLILMIIIIAIIYYVFLRYAPEMIITYGGYAVEGKSMVENLKNSDVSNVNPYLGLIEVHENDLLYKRLNSYYIGEDDKKEIDINYPIYINEGNALLNIGKNTKLITVNYEEVEGYPDFMMTDGVMYNGADITRADGNKYIFLKSEDQIFTNVGKIKITTSSNEYEIKEFSNIYFTEDYIAYYEMQDDSDVQNWYMQYKRINDIDMDSKIEVNGETISYKTFLERLRIIQVEESINNEENENIIEENTVKEDNTTHEENNSNIDKVETNNPDEQKWQEGQWEKPEVKCTDFEGEVYTISTNLSVTDRAGVISRGVIFEIYLDGRLNRRVQATQTGLLEITGLQPSSEYEIRGIFYYNDEDGKDQEEVFYNGTVKTKPISALGTIDFSFQNGKIYSNKIELIHLKLNNDLNEEVIRGISRLQVEIGDAAYRLTNDQIDELKAGKEITFQTNENLTSNSKIKYKITAFDRFGNELKEKNNTGETITSKQAPSASIRVTKQDVTEVDLEISLTNKDNVKLENYRYEITNQSGDVVKQGTLDKNKDKETLIFNDLDPNGYYQITIYGDYDIENGEGVHTNSEIGKASFVTRPLASLGYMQVKIDDKEVTQNSMNLGISIDTVQTDARLVAILNKVEVVVYDQGKNIEYEEGEEPEETEIKRITLTDEQVEQLKVSEEIELNLEQLNSNTKYRIDVIPTVKQGSIEQVVEDKQNLEQIITLKMPAEVQIRNQFVIGTMIDLDMRIEDLDGAVLVDKVRIEVRDKDNKLIDLSEMSTNSEYERKTYEALTPNETYRIIVYAPQYNIGSTDATYEADYILKEIEIVTETGISGNLDLIGLEKTPTGKNLIDVSSKVNWYERCFNTSYEYGFNYNENTKILTLKGFTSDRRRTYYDLSKYLGQAVTISFKARTADSTNISIIEKASDDFNNTSCSTYYTINDLTSDWQEYIYTVTLSKTGYIGFHIVNDNASVEIQDLQAEIGNRKTDYEEFKYDYNANVLVTVNDARNEITTNDYYIRIYKNDKQIQEIRYEELGEDNKVENVQKTYNIEPDANYKIELLVKIEERYYELDSQEFSTESSKELKGIFNLNDFLKIQPYGEYIVLDDLDFTRYSNVSWGQYRFGCNDLYFEGKINFNGKSIIRDTRGDSIFRNIGDKGILENLVFNIKMNNEIEVSIQGMFVSYNYGTIRNIQINLIESTEQNNTIIYFCARNNYGTIENFIVNLQEPLYILRSASLLVGNNSGVIRNGYIYGKNIKVLNESSSLGTSVGEIAVSNINNAIVENVFTLVGIDNLVDVGNNKGNIVVEIENNSTIQKVYSVGTGENTNLSYGPNVYTKTSKKVYNNYYFADEIFTGELETKGNKLSLWDATFQNQLINGDDAFNVDELVNQGYYPQLIMPDVMPAQEYIKLPEVEDADLPDILSTKVLEQGTDTVKVQFSVNNPSAEQISDIKIQNIDVEILSQEYSNGKSTVIAELKNPVICVSSYDILSISNKGAFGSSYTRPYDPGERVINVDLYKEIWNVNDWKEMNDSPTENYMLMADLNFINEGNTVALSNVNGIINGNEHSISNINLSNSSLIKNLNGGTLKNIYIKNFNQEITTNGGVIAYAGTGTLIDDVHMTDVNIVKTESGYCGGIINYTYMSSVRNCSINNIQINANIEETPSTMYIGGIIGYSYSTTIENCYSKGINIQDTRAVNSAVGGIVGHGSSESNSIKNCYAEGTIISENNKVGGIIGAASKINLENCYSKVNISTTNINVGGIIGLYSGSDASTNIINNLSVGNIFTTSGIDAVNRIIGNSTDITDNYAYENQLLNGYARDEAKGAILINQEEILNLDLGDRYNYDSKTNGVLPKLYNTDGTELLPNQTNIYVDDTSGGEVNLEVESVEASKPNTTEAEISVRISNPEEIKITGIEIEDMQVNNITRNVTQNGITNIEVYATPNRYYDTYKLTGIKYINLDGEEQEKSIEIEINVQFYKEIYTYEDWQSIEEGTFQNYRLMADIDFSGKTNIKNNITVNRLEAENNVYTLKNIELEFNGVNVGLINNVRTSIKNIGFENIVLANTSGDGEYFGIIATNNGEIANLTFNNISIEASSMDYIGMIGGMTSGNIENIKLKDITLNGGSYVGGLAGDIGLSTSGEIKNIVGDNITVDGKGDYVGGIIGHQTGNYIEESNISIKNSNITGKDNTGGVFGLAYNGEITYIEVVNTEIYGGSYVGGYAGYNNASSDTSFARKYIEINSCKITGDGSNIGGVVGFVSMSISRFWSVDNSSIIASSINSQNVGGLLGVGSWHTLRYFEITNSEINSNGRNVGGVTGKTNSATISSNEIYGLVNNCVIHAGANVGGVIGLTNYGSYYHVYVNADIKADNNCAGGIIGYMNNTNMNASRYQISVYNTMVLDTKVEASSKAGGLIGDIAKEIYRDQSFYYNNYIDADVISTNTSTGSLIIGGRPDENPYIENTYVYKYSTLNGNYAYAANDNIKDSQYLVRTDLDKQNTFSGKIGLGTTYWNYASVSDGKYPKIKDSYLYYPELQIGVELPTDPEITELNSLSVSDENDDNNANGTGANTNNITDENGISTQSVESLPSYKVYPTKVDEINIDFSDIPEGVSFAYSVNGENVESGSETIEQSVNSEQIIENTNEGLNVNESIELTQKTYTFKYNYRDTLEIKLTNGVDEDVITITPEDVRSNASLVGSNNAYLLGTSLYINGELQQGEYVNVYDGYALNSSGQIVDIATKQTVTNAEDSKNENNTDVNSTNENTYNEVVAESTDRITGETVTAGVVTTSLQQTTTPLHTYSYNGSTIERYGTYSIVNGNIKQQIYNVRSGELSALSNSLDMKIDNYIVDNYNNKEYQTILNSAGELIDLKERLQYPENFLNRNIKQIVQNTDAENPETMVLYNSGKVLIFNYVTGNIVYENEEKADSSLTDYITGSISSIWSDYEQKQQEYAKSKELEAKLAKLPIEEAIQENNKNETGITNENNTIENSNNENLTTRTEGTSNSSSTNTNTTTDNNYITVYNADTGEYEVYSEDEILNGEEENPVSETEKIKQNGLESVYNYDTNEESKPQANGAIIVVSIIAVAIIALAILRKIINKNNSKQEKHTKNNNKINR